MPVIKSAIKKLRQDKKSQKANDAFRDQVDQAVRTAKKDGTVKNVSAAFSLIDKATKKHLLHRNKAGRMKSALSKPKTATSTSAPATTKPTKSKTALKAKAKSAQKSKKAPVSKK